MCSSNITNIFKLVTVVGQGKYPGVPFVGKLSIQFWQKLLKSHHELPSILFFRPDPLFV